MYKHSGIEIKENSINHRTRSTKVQGRSPFQDVTNVVDSRISSDAKQDLRITGTKRPISPSGVSIQSSNLSAVHESILPRNASEHKRYHDRERYMRMTPEQREAYLQRNREYKRRRKNHNVCSDGVQSAASQTDKVSDGNMHTTSLAMRPKEVGTLEVSTSDKILRDNIVNPVTGSQIMVNPCDISTLCNTSTAQNKRTSKFLDRCGEYKKIRLSNAEGCSTTTTETHDYVCALEIDQCKRTSTYMDMMSNFSGKRSTNEGCCISARKGIGNLDDQYIPVKMQVRAAVQEHEDHDSIIYVPTGPFPAIEGDSGQADRLIEDDYEDDESCILSGQDSHYLSYEDINHVICEKQVDPGDHIYQNMPSSHHLLEPVPNCAHCGAKRFQYEKPTFCCMGGKVNIVTPHVPDEVRRLYTSQDPDAKYFQDNNGECKYHYPREFSEATLQGKDSYPIYRRRDDGRQVRIRGAVLDNRWVVPYNPYLLMRYNCHINIEVCSSIKAVKYLFKYIYKGHDRASFIVEAAGDKVINEVREYRDARFISPPEAVWRIYSFNLSEMSPPVLQLQVHLPNMHIVRYKDSDSLENVISSESSSKTMLTEYFRMNSIDSYARNLLYKEFPEFYIWQKNKTWRRRTKRIQIGRLVAAHPAEGERYYLRILLNHVRGATSFEDLRTVEGVVFSTFREAAERRGLIEADDSISDSLTEAATFQMPSALRRLFATVLAFCEVTNVRALWDKHLEAMSDDFRRAGISNEAVEQMVLKDIGDLLYSMGKDIMTFDLPDLLDIGDLKCLGQRELSEEISIAVDKEDLELEASLNDEQRLAFDEILDHVLHNKGKVFFIDGPGGTGKTYLYKALLAKVRSLGLIAIATATSGIAASIMPGGRTAHSRFKIPVSIQEDTMCNFSKQSGTAELLRRASLIIWDEVAMTKRQAVEALDRSLQDITGCRSHFGGKVIVFGGDFRQVLPVVRRGTRAQIVNACLQKSYLWKDIKQIKLQRNMRAQADPWFSDFLLRIGNGTEESIGENYVHLPEEIVIGYTDSQSSVSKLINDIFPSLDKNGRLSSYISARAIISTKNEYVDEINAMLINRFPGEERVYYSFDSAVDDTQNHYQPEFLNSLTPNGLPPHVLKLKINCPVILLRNLDPSNGLCNGTRLIIKAFQDNAIDAEIIGGQHAGKRVFLPRIPLYPSEDDILPFKFKRKQFPIRLSFAMTINKAQGQTIPNVGIYLPEPVFSHGQLYVALSRGVSKKTTRILAKPNKDIDSSGKSTKNIVYKEVLI